ncbi:hypothetical protein CSV79_02410 [Sporosarcina sp. P13]|nr:hypothetical protein CSV79_02410 [Sporosarcina sp. P13]
MYDPTVFENLKVAFENQLYDLDTLAHKINIHNRTDQLDLAVLARKFTLKFSLVHYPAVTVEVILNSSLQELADEILEAENTDPGCYLSLRVLKFVEDLEIQCELIAAILDAVWEGDIQHKQTISYEFGQREADYLHTIDIDFIPKLTEENMSEIAGFLQSVLDMVEQISEI